MTTLHEAAQQALEEYLCREMPAGTIISDPKWWAPKIARAVRSALAQQGEQQPVALCDRICAAIKAADDKCMDEAGYMLDSNDCIRIVREHFAGAAPAAQPTCKQDLQVETEQERYVRMCPDIECGRKKRCTRMVGVSCMSRADIAPAAEPDWSLLEATQESLCEHMAMVKELRAKLAHLVEQPTTEAVMGAITKHLTTSTYPREVAAAAQYIVHRYCTKSTPQPDARKVIEQLLYCVEAWERGCLREDYSRDRDDAIQAGQEWLEENK